MDGENEKKDKPEANIPPKLDLKQAVTPPPPAQPKKATTRIDMAAAAMIPEEKSKTTRINLGAFGPDSGLPKTIKIQRPSEASTIKLTRPPAAAPAAPQAPTAPPYTQAQAKRQTSRISLQEAFIAPAEGQAPGAAPAEAPQPAGPKTIRIKRPGDSGAAAAAEAAAAAAPAADTGIESGPPTQRKTIKLRRPGAEGEAARTAATLPKAAADFAAAQAAGEVSGDEPGPVFAILSLVAMLVCCVLVYMLAAQALPGLGLTWPGQVPTMR